MSILLVSTFKIYIANIAVYLGDFYQGLMGCDMLYRHIKVPCPATIALPRPDLWEIVS